MNSDWSQHVHTNWHHERERDERERDERERESATKDRDMVSLRSMQRAEKEGHRERERLRWVIDIYIYIYIYMYRERDHTRSIVIAWGRAGNAKALWALAHLERSEAASKPIRWSWPPSVTLCGHRSWFLIWRSASSQLAIGTDE